MSDPDRSTPRFTSQAATAEDLLKTQTVGLVQLDDFRKRRRDVEDIKLDSGTVTPRTDGSDAEADPTVKKKKKRKAAGRKLLSFDDEENADDARSPPAAKPSVSENIRDAQLEPKRKFKPNPNANVPAPKALTKSSLAAEAAERERLRAEFIQVQEQVRNSEIAIPFVFYDGSNLPGGTVKVKKGEHIWLFLERCRKLGAEMGVSSEGSVEGGGSKQRVEGKKSWARIGVDDLMLVRGDTIVPHHYEFYYFIANKVVDPNRPGQLLLDYSGTAVLKRDKEDQPLLRKAKDEKVEGHDDVPAYTKVVDRRWYEKNKHIYPASLWREYKTGKEHDEHLQGRRDAQGNSFFFS
ncbi:hypothetical protein OHC33_003348 [Knufia fluminis]|uniref:FAM50A/XAP5 C-terminal domain-containing protein n=1 Tax=Knufia fluminis TaxID=191047 RepID=A0AAN8EPK5_9EURO|nr:hypothetical protein OHC33_003348 [Knufia fluminis]